MVNDVRQYGSSKTLRPKNAKISASNEFDIARLQTYRVMEDLYLNNSEDYAVVLRGNDEEESQRPIYVPNGEKIVEAKIRFLGQGLEFKYSKTDAGYDEKLQSFLDRENWDQKFANLKRWNEIRGDHILLVVGDEEDDEGAKLSIVEIDPSSYFPYESEKNPGTILGVYIVDEYPKPNGEKGEVCHRVQKWMHEYEQETEKIIKDSPISYSETLYETGAWDDRPQSSLKADDIKQLQVLTAEEDLPTQITTLPTYHFRGHPLPNSLFGRSGLGGLETLIGSVNQTMTDEELIMVFGGLGFYWTNSGPPRDAAGNPQPWTISPLAMVEVDNEKSIGRANGVASLEPSQTHMTRAEDEMQQTKGVPDIAVGVVDAAVAESGIALELKLGAILGSAQEQELELKSVLKQFFYNLATQWFPAYEGVGIEKESLKVEVTFKDPKPVNQEKRFNQLMMLWDAGLISAKLITEELSKLLGIDMSEADFKKAQEDKKSMAIAADPFGQQMADEQNAPDDEEQQQTAPSDEVSA